MISKKYFRESNKQCSLANSTYRETKVWSASILFVHCNKNNGAYIRNKLQLYIGYRMVQDCDRKIFTNGLLENFVENIFDEFHNVNAHIY